MTYHILNGELLPATTAAIGLNDLALLRGYGVFDFFSVHRGRSVFLEDHLQRFQRSAALYKLALPLSVEALREQIFRLIRACDMQEGGISLILTGGYAEDGFHADTPPNLLILSRPPVPRFADKQRVETPIKLITHHFVRELPEAKGLNYARALRSQAEMKAAGAGEILYTDGQRVLETYRSNVFLVMPSGKLCTAGSDVLQGITRKYVLQLAAEMGMETETGDIPLSHLAKAKEVFLTGSGKGVFPVSQVDERLIGDGRPGPVWRKLKEAMEGFIEGLYG